MEMLKILIADAGEEFRKSLAERLRGEFEVRSCREGMETLETVRSYRPDLLVLDLMLPGLDGISLLHQLREEGLKPVVLATTRLLNVYVQEAAERLEVDYLMVKPCDAGATAQRVQDLSRYLEVQAPVPVRADLETVTSNVLRSLGLPVRLRGYSYVRDAIVETVRRPGQLVTKELYPTVGKPYHADKVQVERSIRCAINKAWQDRDEQQWRRYFRAEPDGALEKPTNAAFIHGIADRVRSCAGGGHNRF